MAENESPLSEAELGRFVHKLNTFTASLNPREREFLGQMLADAAFLANSDESGYINLEGATDDDVSGFGMDPSGDVLASVFDYASGLSRAHREATELAAAL